MTAARLLAIDPAGLGGAALRARVGPARDRWLAEFHAARAPDAPIARLPVGTGDDRLIGGLDLSATLAAGRPVMETGILAAADGGAIILPMAERLEPPAAARLCAALDDGVVRLERDGLSAVIPARIGAIALDEGAEPDERLDPGLADRLALRLDLTELSIRRAPAAADAAQQRRTADAARARLPGVTAPDGAAAALCQVAAELGIRSLRAPLLALACARAAAAWDGRDEIGQDDLALAARLVLGPRAERSPNLEDMAEEEPEPEPPAPPEDETQTNDPPPDPQEDDPPPLDPQALAEMLVAAAAASLPPDLLATLATGAAKPPRAPSRMGAAGRLRSAARGRAIGTRPGRPDRGARLDLVATLRAAAPWTPLRRRERTGDAAFTEGMRAAEVRPSDFRIKRLKHRAASAIVFAVDASGSTALQRLGEAKGAVETLLADAYRRRDEVALIAFRGTGAEVLLPPTRSLVRAKKSLAALPGGGGTPLAAGLEEGLTLALAIGRKGATPTLALLTDGRANVRRDGTGGRAAAAEEALTAARAVRAAGVSSVVIDASVRPAPEAAALAAAMGARYVPLPRADAARLAAAIRSDGPDDAPAPDPRRRSR